jgi:hypothetical protein
VSDEWIDPVIVDVILRPTSNKKKKEEKKKRKKKSEN